MALLLAIFATYTTLRAHFFEDGVTNASSRRHPRLSAGVHGVLRDDTGPEVWSLTLPKKLKRIVGF